MTCKKRGEITEKGIPEVDFLDRGKGQESLQMGLETEWQAVPSLPPTFLRLPKPLPPRPPVHPLSRNLDLRLSHRNLSFILS